MKKPADVAPGGHVHVRVVVAHCPNGHAVAALAGTAAEPSDEALVEGFVALIEERLDLHDTCQTCGAPRDDWQLRVFQSPPMTEDQAAAVASRVAALAMADAPGVVAYELTIENLLGLEAPGKPTVVH